MGDFRFGVGAPEGCDADSRQGPAAVELLGEVVGLSGRPDGNLRWTHSSSCAFVFTSEPQTAEIHNGIRL